MCVSQKCVSSLNVMNNICDRPCDSNEVNTSVFLNRLVINTEIHTIDVIVIIIIISSSISISITFIVVVVVVIVIVIVIIIIIIINSSSLVSIAYLAVSLSKVMNYAFTVCRIYMQSYRLP